MAKPIILYGTLTGNTEEVATKLHEAISKELPDLGLELANVRNFNAAEFVNYNWVIFGTSTWDDGNPNFDTEDFFYKLATIRPNLSANHYAIFGLGDSAYPNYNVAIGQTQEELEQYGGHVEPTTFPIDGFPRETTMVELVAWAKKFLSQNND